MTPEPGPAALRCPTPEADTVESSAVTRYHRWLLAAIAASTFFEGFDQAILALVAPYVARDFALGPDGLGLMMSAIGIGAVLALAITMQADRFGRRLMLMITVAGYGVGTGLTALAQGPVDFALLQLVTRVFLTAEVALAVVVVAEEIPARRRGFAISLVITAGLAGSAASAFVLGPAMSTAMGWRAMYVVGLLPLLLVVALRFGIRETRRFASMRAASPEREARWNPWRVWQPPHRRPLVLCIVLFGLIGALVTTFPSFYAYFLVNERGFAPGQVSVAYGLAMLMGIPAVPLAGALLDRWGRRRVGVAGPILGAIGLAMAFNATGSVTEVTLGGMFGIFVGTFILPIQMTYVPELFPTRVRTLAASWISNGAGRALMIASPLLTGLLARVLGSTGLAASLMAACGIVASALVYAAMPETMGLQLEETAGETSARAHRRV